MPNSKNTSIFRTQGLDIDVYSCIPEYVGRHDSHCF